MSTLRGMELVDEKFELRDASITEVALVIVPEPSVFMSAPFAPVYVKTVVARFSTVLATVTLLVWLSLSVKVIL